MYTLLSICALFWLAATVIGFLVVMERRYWMFEPWDEHSELYWTLRPLWRETRCHLCFGDRRRKKFAEEISKAADISLEKAQAHVPGRWGFCLLMLALLLAAAPMVVATLSIASYQQVKHWYLKRQRHL